MQFSYEAKDEEGRTVTGSLDAKDERTATSLVREKGYFLMRLAPMAPQNVSLQPTGTVGAVAAWPSQPSMQNGLGDQASAFPYLQDRPPTVGRWLEENVFRAVWTGVGVKELSLFYRQFATLIDAGVPVLQSFETLGAQTSNATLRRCLNHMRGIVDAGGQISDAMAEFPWLFKVNQRALVVAGEASGNLDKMFIRIADALELEHTFKSNIIKEITMPIITFAMAFLLPPLYLIVVNNNFHAYYEEAISPLLWIIGTIFCLYVFGKIASQIKYAYDAVLANFPGLGGTIRMIAIARFARTLASLYAAGVSVPRAVKYATDACGNEFLARRLLTSIELMEGGYGIVDAMLQTRVFPPIVISMLGIGETTGNVDAMMDKIADHFEQESLVRLHQAMVAVRVLAILLIGYKVLMVLVHFYSGYFGSMMNDSGVNDTGGE